MHISPVNSTASVPGVSSAEKIGGSAPVKDSISPSSLSALSTSAWEKPRLTPPSQSTTERFLSLTDDFHNCMRMFLHNCSQQIDATKQHCEELMQANLAKLQESARKAQDVGLWSLLEDMASSLLSVVYMFLGQSIGGWVGGYMIAAGVLSIVNFALHAGNGWNWIACQLSDDQEQRKKIESLLPTIVGVGCAVMGLGGMAAGYMTGALVLNQTLLTLQGVLVVIQATTSLGKGLSDASMLKTQAQLSPLHAEFTTENFKIEDTIQETSGSLKMMNQVHKNASNLLRDQSQSIQQILNIQG